ncbi:MAG: MurR/RpiR family transcriptional regulator [Halocynthiibacter sp.]
MLSFADHLARAKDPFTPTERRVIDYLLNNREAAIVASAAELARAVGTSDATIIRTARRLGFSGLDALRRGLAHDLRRDLTLAERLDNSLDRVGASPAAALGQTIGVLRQSLDRLETAASAAEFNADLQIICGPGRKLVFGIGPSGFVAGYFAEQLNRLGCEALALRDTGLQFADEILKMRKGDNVIALAYDRPYPEITALFDRAVDLSVPRILITAPSVAIPDYRADVTLRVARGQSDGFSLHAATLAVIEALIVGYAGLNRESVHRNLENLNEVRQRLAGDGLDL